MDSESKRRVHLHQPMIQPREQPSGLSQPVSYHDNIASFSQNREELISRFGEDCYVAVINRSRNIINLGNIEDETEFMQSETFKSLPSDAFVCRLGGPKLPRHRHIPTPVENVLNFDYLNRLFCFYALNRPSFISQSNLQDCWIALFEKNGSYDFRALGKFENTTSLVKSDEFKNLDALDASSLVVRAGSELLVDTSLAFHGSAAKKDQSGVYLMSINVKSGGRYNVYDNVLADIGASDVYFDAATKFRPEGPCILTAMSTPSSGSFPVLAFTNVEVGIVGMPLVHVPRVVIGFDQELVRELLSHGTMSQLEYEKIAELFINVLFKAQINVHHNQILHN